MVSFEKCGRNAVRARQSQAGPRTSSFLDPAAPAKSEERKAKSGFYYTLARCTPNHPFESAQVFSSVKPLSCTMVFTISSVYL